MTTSTKKTNRSKKRLIVCCDGTWNDLEMRDLTNVGRLVQALLPTGMSNGAEIPQIVFYDDGVGADSNGLQRKLEGMVGMGIDNLIYEAYRFICINYEEGDELCLFGFSRGAFTVRSVAGLIEKAGLLTRDKVHHAPKAIKAYREKGTEQFKQKYVKRDYDPTIDLLGCWDTVGARGIPDKIPNLPLDEAFNKRFQFHNLKLGAHIQRALHAVAIDEHRKEFCATLMEKDESTTTRLVQTWFPGDHGCVGGGSWGKRGLSNRCLRWMVETAKEEGVDLGVDFTRLYDHALCDHSISFQGIDKFFYGPGNRSMPSKHVSWKDIDETVKKRWLELGTYYRPTTLKRRFASDLNALPLDGIRRPLTAATELDEGESADVRVHSAKKENPSHILVMAGQTYEIEVPRLQVWKDGDLDPCSIQGWNLIKGDDAKAPYESGKKADLGAVKSWLIKKGRQKRVVPESDWFELILKIGDSDFIPLGIREPEETTEPFRIQFTANESGELIFAANDCSLFYENNQGWIWARVTRKS